MKRLVTLERGPGVGFVLLTAGASGQQVSCANLGTQPEAQADNAAIPSATNLDADRDGLACEELPYCAPRH